MSQKHNLNKGWLFCPNDISGAEAAAFDDSTWERVSVPHTNKILPHHEFDDAEYQFVSWYRKRVTIPANHEGRAFLDFDGVMIACEVFINGERITEHKGGYTPFSIELTDLVKPGEEALVALRVDSTERADIPPCGDWVDYMTFGGLYRDVTLRLSSRSYIKDAFAWCEDVFAMPSLSTDVEIVDPEDGQALSITIRDAEGRVVSEKAAHVSGGKTRVTVDGLGGVRLWELDDPYLHSVEIVLRDYSGAALDSYKLRFGFREVKFCEDGAFRLNEQEIKLRGLDRHQMFPYIGQAAPARLQKRDADILKYDLALNIVRTSHYPQSPHFLDRCDEVGLLVFEEIPGWQHIGDEAWKEISKRDVRDMIVRDRNHPCIVLWGVRINESLDDHDFYAETNRIAHETDPTRQTGGVRYFQESEFLEDVFTYNDFSNEILEPVNTPHLVTEYSGHMFPTKTWDCEERRVEHALRHAKIQSLQMVNPKVSGAIGWCAFDYNTHNKFGSGDRICYHGVSDIFRLPKWAAHFYASQADPRETPVLEVASTWTFGDRSAGGVEPLVIFSNCETIKVYIGDEYKGEFQPAKEQYPGLIHAPFIVTDLGPIFNKFWQDLRVEGYFKGKKVAEAIRSNDPIPAKLLAWTDSNELSADGQDMTALSFRVADKNSNVCPYTSEIVTVAAEGPVRIIGTNPFAPQGGQGAVYIKATEEPGDATIRVSTPRLGTVEVKIKVVPES